MNKSFALVLLSIVFVSFAAHGATRAGEGNQRLDIHKQNLTLPQSQALKAPPVSRDLTDIKPPRTDEFYESNTKEAEYEHLVDEEISTLYRLTQQSKTDPNRGELWLRLGELYVEKARLIEFREQANYDRKLKDFAAKKTAVKPKIDNHLAHEFNRKAVQLYEWFIKDFPRDTKVDQALFFLGYNQFELGNPQAGEKHYLELVQRFPESSYVIESYFALGEYYFENEQWKKALDSYQKVVAAKRARLNVFALYKSAWCYYRLGQVSASLQSLERVVRISRAGGEGSDGAGRRALNKVRLANEALKDYVPFFAESGDPKNAASEFERLAGDEKQAHTMLERLAYVYSDAGNRPAARYVFKQLISMDPNGEKSAEYQYQVVLAFSTSDPKEFRRELEIWLEQFGPMGDWAKANAGAQNGKLVSDVARLQETTVRNRVLQLHQIAQNSRSESAQRAADAAYVQYFKFFPNTPQSVEMAFFHAELLFDMGRNADAAALYAWVADKEPHGKYHERSVINTLLALEKDLPTPQAIEAKRGKSLEKIPLDPSVDRFTKAALKFVHDNPKSEKTSDIKRRLGVLFYSYNHFDEAIDIFEQVIRDDPKSPNAEIAGNLILDIYKLRNDMAGLAAKGRELLANPAIANSHFGSQIRGMLENASYLGADKMAADGQSAEAAKEFERFASTSKQPELAAAARYKAAVNYEKAGDTASAIRMHGLLLATGSSDPKVKSLQNDSRNVLARLYQKTGQLEQAAREYHEYASANPKDQKAINGFYNAGVLWEALGDSNSALSSYEAYRKHSNNPDRGETVFLSAEIYRKRGASTRAEPLYEEYLKSGPHNEGHAIQACFEIADFAYHRRQIPKAKKWYEATIDRFKKAKGASRSEGAKYAAESRFRLSQDTLGELFAVRFTKKEKQQGKAAVEIKKLREKYIGEMKEVIRFDNAEWIVAALTSGGKMFDDLSQVFAKIPTPSGYSADDAKKYRELIDQQIAGFNNEASNSYKAAIDKSRELESYTEWTKIAVNGFNAHNPNQPATSGEMTKESVSMDWMGL